jgi:kynurenine formamidase
VSSCQEKNVHLIDLSHTLEPGMPVYPGLPAPIFTTVFTHDESAERGLYAPGTVFQIAGLTLCGNTGTYIDAPFHRHRDRADLAGLRLEQLADLPGMVVDASAIAGRAIDARLFEGRDVAGMAVLIRTDWSRRWGTLDYWTPGPFLAAEGARWLAERGPALVGIDAWNIDDTGDPSRPAHTILLGTDIVICEHMCALDRLPAQGFRFSAVAPRIAGGTSFPVRAYARVE